jgi:hypothetical protein
MGKDVSAEEIKSTIFSMKSNKAPRLDGSTAGSIIGMDLIQAIQSFFKSGKLLKEANATTNYSFS